jgi:flagellar biosynthetic protein FliR
MIPDLAAILPVGQAALWAGGLVFLRIGTMMFLIPAFGEASVPVRVRLGLALAFTLIVAPAVPPVPPVAGLAVLGLGAAEIVAGLFFGVMLRLFVLALQIAGTIAGQASSLSQLFGGTAGADPQPAIGHVLVVTGLALAAAGGLHVRVAAFIIDGYGLLPAGRMIGAGVVLQAGLAEIGQCLGLAFGLAAPFVVAALLYNLMLGIINRAMPQLMVSFVGAPALTAGGMGLLLLAAPALLAVWLAAFEGFLASPFGPR